MGLGGVYYFNKGSIQRRISLVVTNEFSKFMWVWIQGSSPLLRAIYISMCSTYATHNGLDGNPFIILYANN